MGLPRAHRLSRTFLHQLNYRSYIRHFLRSAPPAASDRVAWSVSVFSWSSRSLAARGSLDIYLDFGRSVSLQTPQAPSKGRVNLLTRFGSRESLFSVDHPEEPSWYLNLLKSSLRVGGRAFFFVAAPLLALPRLLPRPLPVPMKRIVSQLQFKALAASANQERRPECLGLPPAAPPSVPP